MSAGHGGGDGQAEANPAVAADPVLGPPAERFGQCLEPPEGVFGAGSL